MALSTHARSHQRTPHSGVLVGEQMSTFIVSVKMIRLDALERAQAECWQTSVIQAPSHADAALAAVRDVAFWHTTGFVCITGARVTRVVAHA